jgi:hypothetical protein
LGFGTGPGKARNEAPAARAAPPLPPLLTHTAADTPRSLTSRAGSYAKRVRWINANREAIVGALKELMLAPAPAGVAA